MQTDAEMLLRYARDRDEQAFAILVQRHLGMVYGAALRRTGGRSQLAEDIAQRVFVDLARKAAWLSGHPALTGWLHRSTRYAAIDAMRAEQQKEKLTQVLQTMANPISAPDDQVEWSGVRPLLDDALDRLGKTDREAVLLRYFEGLTHAEVGMRLRVSESAARMRAERALGKLRGHLARRGVTSTASALGLMLSNHAFAALPSGLASNVTQTALAATPAAGGLIATILMSKLTIPTLGAVLVSGATALIWTATAGGTTADELAALRAENLRLSQAVTENNAGVTSATPPHRLPLTAANAVNETEPAGEAVSPRGHRNEGLDTPLHGLLTFAWACDLADPVEIENVITFDPDVRIRAEEIRLTMPAKVRAEYGTPEAFYGLVLAVTCLEAPPPGRDLFKNFEMVEVSPGRAVAKKPNGKLDNREFQLTETGWKYVVPLVGVENMVKNLNSPMLERLVKR